jgi:F-type H+-transporting ATPase subunit delta
MEEMNTIARPYAQAALSQAEGEGSLAEWSDMLHFLASIVREPAIATMVANPRISAERLTEVLLSISADKLSATGANFLRILIANDRIPAVPEIHAQFELRRAELEGRRQVAIVSAYEMTDTQQLSLAAAMTRHLGREVDVTVTVDAALIGGVVIRVGDLVIDASMRGRLAQLGNALGAAA